MEILLDADVVLPLVVNDSDCEEAHDGAPVHGGLLNLQAANPPPPPGLDSDADHMFAELGYGTHENFEIAKYAIDHQLSL